MVYNVCCCNFAGIAQLVEQRIRNAQVACSSHVSSSIKSRLFFKRLFIFAQNGKTIVFGVDLRYNI